MTTIGSCSTALICPTSVSSACSPASVSRLISLRSVAPLSRPGDPLLRVFRTKVHAARPASIAAPPPPKGKGLKKKSAASAGGSGATSAAASGTSTPAPAEAKSEGKGHVIGDGGIKGVQVASGGSSGKLWEVELLDTVVFPEGNHGSRPESSNSC